MKGKDVLMVTKLYKGSVWHFLAAAKPQNIFDLVHCRPRNSVDSYYLS